MLSYLCLYLSHSFLPYNEMLRYINRLLYYSIETCKVLTEIPGETASAFVLEEEIVYIILREVLSESGYMGIPRRLQGGIQCCVEYALAQMATKGILKGHFES